MMAIKGHVNGEDDSLDWAEVEFGAADLGDQRRRARLIQMAKALGAQPSASLPEATGNTAAMKAAYRFFDSDAITPEAILASHIQATYARLQAERLILAAQDTTYLDWTTHGATSGLGPLASAQQQGLLAHTTLAFTPERLPLGVLAQQVWARDAATYGQLPDQHQRPIEDKESAKWLTSLASVNGARAACPDTHFVSVGDREADVYELFTAERAEGVDLLVRASWDRRLDDPQGHLWAAVEEAPIVASVTLHLPRRGQRAARDAVLEVRTRAVTLHPPQRPKGSPTLPPVTLWAVWAREIEPPSDAEGVDWRLLTTCPTRTADEAIERLSWYACRWGCEVFHKVLKSGCRIEARQLATAARLERSIALYSVIAWRVLYATLLARTAPTLPCTLVLTEDEWQALYCTIHRVPTPPATPPTLQEAVRWMARLGGFTGRAADGQPGPVVIWRGFQHLADLTTMYRIMRPSAPP